jgi:hypothetical protein
MEDQDGVCSPTSTATHLMTMSRTLVYPAFTSSSESARETSTTAGHNGEEDITAKTAVAGCVTFEKKNSKKRIRDGIHQYFYNFLYLFSIFFLNRF